MPWRMGTSAPVSSRAILLQTPVNVFLHALRVAGNVFVPLKVSVAPTIKKIVGWSNIARREGLLGLEAVAEQEPDLFVRKGMQLLVDGNEPEIIREIAFAIPQAPTNRPTWPATVISSIKERFDTVEMPVPNPRKTTPA